MKKSVPEMPMANATGIPITRRMMNAQDTNNIGHASEMRGGIS
jgi:hypothetical protein